MTADSTVTLLPLAAKGDRRAIEILLGRMRSPEEHAVERSTVDVCDDALRQLDPGDRLFIIYRLQHGYSFQQLATELGKPSADAARMGYNRALQRLRDEVQRRVSPLKAPPSRD